MRLLLAIDDSQNAQRAVRYVGALLKSTPEIFVTLFHVLKPIPRALMEHGGSENPAIEAQLSARLREDHESWLRKEREAECPLLLKACEMLAQFGFDTTNVTLKFGHEDDVAANILDEARIGRHDCDGPPRNVEDHTDVRRWHHRSTTTRCEGICDLDHRITVAHDCRTFLP